MQRARRGQRDGRGRGQLDGRGRGQRDGRGREPVEVSHQQRAADQRRARDVIVPKCQAVGISLNPLQLGPLQKLLRPMEIATLVVANDNGRLHTPSEDDEIQAYLPPPHETLKVPQKSTNYKLATFKLTQMYYKLMMTRVRDYYKEAMVNCPHNTTTSQKAGRMVTWETFLLYYNEVQYFFYHFWCLNINMTKEEAFAEGLSLLTERYKQLGDAKDLIEELRQDFILDLTLEKLLRHVKPHIIRKRSRVPSHEAVRRFGQLSHYIFVSDEVEEACLTDLEEFLKTRCKLPNKVNHLKYFRTKYWKSPMARQKDKAALKVLKKFKTRDEHEEWRNEEWLTSDADKIMASNMKLENSSQQLLKDLQAIHPDPDDKSIMNEEKAGEIRRLIMEKFNADSTCKPTLICKKVPKLTWQPLISYQRRKHAKSVLRDHLSTAIVQHTRLLVNSHYWELVVEGKTLEGLELINFFAKNQFVTNKGTWDYPDPNIISRQMDDTLDGGEAKAAIAKVALQLLKTPEAGDLKMSDLETTVAEIEETVATIVAANTAIKRNSNLQKDRDKFLPPRLKTDKDTGEILESREMLPPSKLWTCKNIEILLKIKEVNDALYIVHGITVLGTSVTFDNFRLAMLSCKMHSTALAGDRNEDLVKAFATWVKPDLQRTFFDELCKFITLFTKGGRRDLSDPVFKVLYEGSEAFPMAGTSAYVIDAVDSKFLMDLTVVKNAHRECEDLGIITKTIIQNHEDMTAGEDDGSAMSSTTMAIESDGEESSDRSIATIDIDAMEEYDPVWAAEARTYKAERAAQRAAAAKECNIGDTNKKSGMELILVAMDMHNEMPDGMTKRRSV